MRVQPVFSNPNDPMQALRFLAASRMTLLQADDDAGRVMRGRDQVLERFGPLFRDHSSSLSGDDLAAFLSFKANSHWTGLHRQKGKLLSSLDVVRKAIGILVNRPSAADNVGERFDQAEKMVDGFGEGIITPILFVAFPSEYGVWNAKSQFAMQLLGLWPPPNRHESKGKTYEHVNAQLYYARQFLNDNLEPGVHPVDLWTIDYFWHAIKVMHDDGRLEGLIEKFKRR